MQEKDIIEAVQASFGGFVRPQGNIWAWRINGQPALALLKDVRPFLVIERRRKIADLLLSDPVLNYTDSRGQWADKRRHTQHLFEMMKLENAYRLTAPPSIEPSPRTEADIQYLAGILDGEGHVVPSKRRLEVWSTDPELPAWLESKFDGRVYVGRKAKGNQRASWRWHFWVNGNMTPPDWCASAAQAMQLQRKASLLSRW